MPFTLAHAVVALPLRRTPLVPAAVAVGAMTPDVPLFLRGMRLDYGFTHTVGNAVWTAVIALLLFLVWRMLLRPASLQLAPIWIASRLPRRWRVSGLSAAREALGAGQPRGYPLMLALSLVLGVLSHIVWDMFTHGACGGRGIAGSGRDVGTASRVQVAAARLECDLPAGASRLGMALALASATNIPPAGTAGVGPYRLDRVASGHPAVGVDAWICRARTVHG